MPRSQPESSSRWAPRIDRHTNRMPARLSHPKRRVIDCSRTGWNKIYSFPAACLRPFFLSGRLSPPPYLEGTALSLPLTLPSLTRRPLRLDVDARTVMQILVITYHSCASSAKPESSLTPTSERIKIGGVILSIESRRPRAKLPDSLEKKKERGRKEFTTCQPSLPMKLEPHKLSPGLRNKRR